MVIEFGLWMGSDLRTAKAYATQPFVWTLGGIIGSAMGGFLAQPAKFYPNTFSEDGIFGRYPYLLPNLVAAVGIVLAIVQGIFFLEETLPMQEEVDEEVTQAVLIEPSINERAPLLPNAHSTLPRDGRPRDRNSISRASISRASRSRAFSGGSSFRARSMSIVDGLRQIRKKPSFMEDGMPSAIDQRFDIRRDSFGTMHSIKMSHHEILPAPITRPEPNRPKKTFNTTVVMLTLALTIIAFHQMAYITNLPVYLLDESASDGIDFIGGLGLDLHDVGTFLAVNGLIALFTQGVIFPYFVEKVGVWNTFVSMIVLYPTTYLIVPFISALPENLVSPGVYLSLFLQGLFGILVFPCALILLKNATPSPLVLGRVNGAAMSACCLARTISSPLVGVVYSAGGSAAAWFFLAVCAVVGALQLFWVPKDHMDGVIVENFVQDTVSEIMHPHHQPPHISDTDSVAVTDYDD